MDTKHTLPEVDDDCRIISTRVFDAPREAVFKAWTDPAQLIHWWCPKGFTNTFQEYDLRPGGNWRFILHDLQGSHYSNECIFTEITRPVRIAWDHISKPSFRVVAAFDDESGRTKVTFSMLFPSAEACEKIKPLVIESNEQLFDRLATRLRNN